MVAPLDPAEQRAFAVDVVRRLRGAGFEAYLAGGCVRDHLLGQPAKDYDVATNATPQQVRHLFGNRTTLAIGAAFGVIVVRGPKGSGQVEVTTFRTDAGYSDGRHPDAVRFSTAEEDAARRDFTLNGLFLDPFDNRVIDYVDGVRDLLERKVVRAIGDPRARFAEDKLRLLRAVRFAARLEYALDGATEAAIREMADQITVVSPERIAQELRQLLVAPQRRRAADLLAETGLLAAVLPEITASLPAETSWQAPAWQESLAVLDALVDPSFPMALATVMHPLARASHEPTSDARLAAAAAIAGGKIGERLRLPNKEIQLLQWLLEHKFALVGAASQPWPGVQRILAADEGPELVRWLEALAAGGVHSHQDAAWCRKIIDSPRETWDPAALISGNDVLDLGVSPGPIVRELLDAVRDAQLEGKIQDRKGALELLAKLTGQLRGNTAHG